MELKTPFTAARRALSSAGPLAWVNLALLGFFPVAWVAPLARAGFLPFFQGDELTIIGGVSDLWASDPALALLIAFFALFAPYAKTLLLAGIHFDLLQARRWSGSLTLIGKLSMADIFLLALYIVLVKGVGVGHVETAWGLWLFTALVLTSFAVALLTDRRAGKRLTI
ncbi:paraquat-inducible protein A [Pikeienuella piscinae]|uniref:Paraquat-inducible protein A n=1 Tax=Pikeienuella piscinae TaxID=2748098 RepID=A0A7L5BY51_9RHOB|nr:paraquat-inducible protein A [Pikeienuella piscinae]QIE54529.1 paraquat-inducible protein A [Pikeienuella piscinae]